MTNDTQICPPPNPWNLFTLTSWTKGIPVATKLRIWRWKGYPGKLDAAKKDAERESESERKPKLKVSPGRNYKRRSTGSPQEPEKDILDTLNLASDIDFCFLPSRVLSKKCVA